MSSNGVESFGAGFAFLRGPAHGGARQVEKMVSQITLAAAFKKPPKFLRRASSRANSISAKNFGSIKTNMQMPKTKSACAVPLQFARYGLNDEPTMSESPVYFWYE
jgi:hypothetical protein